MHPQNFMIFGTYKLHRAENEMMLSLCHYLFIYLFIYLRTQHSKQYKIEDTIKAAKF